ncbi:hypothetical protein A4A49_30908 [Nicotiana attenuata]|uniref:Uncharacterized protein n=1 Tax=Nicotiana attenuata TaxID=49451 RepID=A0A1J6KH53_NICAT|nr:hypothetical protein A4A49_30908 [Nicotiana attenuata]
MWKRKMSIKLQMVRDNRTGNDKEQWKEVRDNRVRNGVNQNSQQSKAGKEIVPIQQSGDHQGKGSNKDGNAGQKSGEDKTGEKQIISAGKEANNQVQMTNKFALLEVVDGEDEPNNQLALVEAVNNPKTQVNRNQVVPSQDTMVDKELTKAPATQPDGTNFPTVQERVQWKGGKLWADQREEDPEANEVPEGVQADDEPVMTDQEDDEQSLNDQPSAIENQSNAIVLYKGNEMPYIQDATNETQVTSHDGPSHGESAGRGGEAVDPGGTMEGTMSKQVTEEADNSPDQVQMIIIPLKSSQLKLNADKVATMGDIDAREPDDEKKFKRLRLSITSGKRKQYESHNGCNRLEGNSDVHNLLTAELLVEELMWRKQAWSQQQVEVIATSRSARELRKIMKEAKVSRQTTLEEVITAQLPRMSKRIGQHGLRYSGWSGTRWDKGSQAEVILTRDHCVRSWSRLLDNIAVVWNIIQMQLHNTIVQGSNQLKRTFKSKKINCEMELKYYIGEMIEKWQSIR